MPIILDEEFAPTAISALDLITTAAQLLGAIGQGEALTADEATAGLRRLNSMLDAWSIDKLMIYNMQQESFTWAANTTSRTIGSGGAFDATRPIKLSKTSFFRDTSTTPNVDYFPIV